MLVFNVPDLRLYDEERNTFFTYPGFVLTLEHSLLSISKWESVWKKPFLSDKPKTKDEMVDYLRRMTISPPEYKIPSWVYEALPSDITRAIAEYIEDPKTATTFSKRTQTSRNKEVITSELIYYWMVAQNIPFDAEKWHLNRLLTLINVCSIKNTPPKKLNRRDILERNTKLNEERRRLLKSSG